MSVILAGDYVALTDGATVATDASLGDSFSLAGFLGARTIANPTNPTTGQIITYLIENTGVVSATSWGSAFVLAGAWTEPAPDRARSITFFYNGSAWVEMSRTGWDLKLIAFDPADVASLVGWWDASSLAALADADPVSSWTARVGRDLAASSGKEPTYKTAIQNSRPIARFDGTDDVMTVANPLLGATDASIFAVFAKGNTSAGARTVMDLGGSGNNGLALFEGDTTANRVKGTFGYGSGQDTNIASTVGTAFHQWSWTIPGGGTPNLYQDAGSAITPTNSHTADLGASGLSQATAYVGALALTLDFMTGDLAELIVYSTALSDPDRAAVASYLKTKWGTP